MVRAMIRSKFNRPDFFILFCWKKNNCSCMNSELVAAPVPPPTPAQPLVAPAHDDSELAESAPAEAVSTSAALPGNILFTKMRNSV